MSLQSLLSHPAPSKYGRGVPDLLFRGQRQHFGPMVQPEIWGGGLGIIFFSNATIDAQDVFLLAKGTTLRNLARANCTPLLEEKDLKNDRLKNYFFWTFATHMTQIPPKKYNFNQFAAFFHFLFFKINYYFV